MRLHQIAALFSLCAIGYASADPTIAVAVDPTGVCVDYNDPSVSLTGTLFSRTYFGPPNYGEKPSEDSREAAALLLR
jgi:hypothetical protein